MRVSAIILKKGKVLLIRRKREGMEEYWLFPGGEVEKGETPERAIIREVYEETSLKVVNCLYSFDYLDKDGNKHPVFLCKVKGGEPKINKDSPEAEAQSEKDQYSPEWVTLDKAIALTVYPEEGLRVLKNLHKNEN
jgi:mutator protein MutT